MQFLATPPYDPPSVWEITPAEYHADRTHLTRSMLSDFVDSPRRFHDRWISGELPPKKTTDAMALGTVFHAMMAGGVAGVATWSQRRQGNKWEAFKAEKEAAGLLILPDDQYTIASGMRAACEADPWVAERLKETPIHHEHVILWNYGTGLRCKCMVDCLVGSTGPLVVLDWKSTADPTPEGWNATSRRFNLHRQAAHYSAGIFEMYGAWPEWVYVVVGTEPPHDVYLHRPAGSVMDLGDEEIGTALEGVRACLESGEWHHADRGDVIDYDYPSWYMRGRG